MQTTNPESAKDETTQTPAETLQSQLAARIRDDSATLARPTLAGSLAPFFADLTPEQTRAAIAQLLNDEQYRDIKLLNLPDAAYFYSDRHLTPEDAKKVGLIEEAKGRIAAQVRQDSNDPAKLTPVEALAPLLSGLEGIGEIGSLIGPLLDDERYKDIESITASTGAAFLFSTKYMTRNYATLAARVEAKDPAALIAETVRDESRIYPRPTNLNQFMVSPFNLDFTEIQEAVARMQEQEHYADIERLVASTGVVYLFSNRYLHKASAKRKMEWEEVGRFQNP